MSSLWQQEQQSTEMQHNTDLAIQFSPDKINCTCYVTSSAVQVLVKSPYILG